MTSFKEIANQLRAYEDLDHPICERLREMSPDDKDYDGLEQEHGIYARRIHQLRDELASTPPTDDADASVLAALVLDEAAHNCDTGECTTTHHLAARTLAVFLAKRASTDLQGIGVFRDGIQLSTALVAPDDGAVPDVAIEQLEFDALGTSNELFEALQRDLNGTATFGERLAASLCSKNSKELANVSIDDVRVGNGLVDSLEEAHSSLLARLNIVNVALLRLQWWARQPVVPTSDIRNDNFVEPRLVEAAE